MTRRYDVGMNPPVKVGERLVVYGRPEAAIVSECSWNQDEVRWDIRLNWGPHGKSWVYGHDEGKVWFRYGKVS